MDNHDHDYESMPPEIAAAVRRQHEQHQRFQMEQDEAAHRLSRWVHGLDAEALSTLGMLLTSVSGNKRQAVYWSGQVAALQQSRFNVCYLHGIDHDEELRVGMEAEVAATAEDKGEPTPEQKDEPEFEPSDAPQFVNYSSGVNSKTELDMIDYRLIVNEDGYAACQDCGRLYPSVEDRMLKDRGDCPGCIHKTKFGG